MTDGAQVGASLPGRIAVVFAAVMHAAVGAFVLAAGRVVPVLVALALGVLWSVLATLIWRWRHTRPLVVLGLPFVGAVAWWLAVANLGGS